VREGDAPLFVTQRAHRIDPARAARGNEPRRGLYHREQRNGCEGDPGIVRLESVQLRGDEPARRRGHGHARRETDGEQKEHFFHHEPLTPGTFVKAVHITELRVRIDALRAAHALPAYSWTDPTITAGSSVVRAQHILELRTALSEAYAATPAGRQLRPIQRAL
jgi:hypothetical protein